jgi:hypothetical protein
MKCCVALNVYLNTRWVIWICLLTGCTADSTPQVDVSEMAVSEMAVSEMAVSEMGVAEMNVPEVTVPNIDLQYTEEREPCARRTPTREAFFGDLHVHTSFSFDAGAYHNVLTPSDAYAFARGETVKLPPLDAEGRGTREVMIDRPLHFLAVTDHGDLLGEVSICTTPNSEGYESDQCQNYRSPEGRGAFSFGVMLASLMPKRVSAICGDDDLRCLDASKERWTLMREAAESYYDRTSECKLTTFVGYEYTNTRAISNLHRNVIFRNRHVPDLPISYFEAPRPLDLWRRLDEECIEGDFGCDVLSLPHNSNLSNGQLFYPKYPDANTPEEERDIARLRARLETVGEVFQHKGDSECRNGFSEEADDPFCTFEKLRPANAVTCLEDEPGGGGMRLGGCVHRLDFLRNVLLQGLTEQRRLGVNPYPLGFIGSTDTHNGTPGHVSTDHFIGHIGIVDDTAAERLGEGNITHDGIINNPGGLAGVWAVENSRDAIFEAIRRKETFATSGPRILPRLFIGTEFDTDLCERADRLAYAYAEGEPMGSQVSIPLDKTPTFLIEAQADLGGAQTSLERIQLIKGWIDHSGETRWEIFDVAGEKGDPEEVIAERCDPIQAEPQPQLCTVWRDPNFDPTLATFYYARVIERPTCRWSTLQCKAITSGERPEGCADPDRDRRIRHRAWTSPVWHIPQAQEEVLSKLSTHN